MNLTVIIPNFNGQKVLLPCLQSINCAFKPKDLILDVIVVDNGSTDGSGQLFPNTIHLRKNHGFGFACNQGVSLAKSDYVFILNNDTILDPNFFVNFTKHFNSNYQCFCFTVLNGSQIESQGISFDYSGKCLQINNTKKLNSKLSTLNPFPVWGSSAAAVIYSRSAYQKLNGFDPQYFNYLEDVDLAFRFKQAGYKTLLIPPCQVNHLGGATAKNYKFLREFYTFRNWFIFILKNYSFPQIVKHLPQIFTERLRNLSYLLKSIYHDHRY